MKHVKAAGERNDQPTLVPVGRVTGLLQDVLLRRNCVHFFLVVFCKPLYFLLSLRVYVPFQIHINVEEVMW